MLPCLLELYPTWLALLISGVVWALFHVAVMVLLSRRLKVKNANLTVLCQAAGCTVSALPFAAIAMMSGFSVYPCALAHTLWNRVVPPVLGSIYTQQPGMVVGRQWLINAEGLAGCIVQLPLAFAVLMYYR